MSIVIKQVAVDPSGTTATLTIWDTARECEAEKISTIRVTLAPGAAWETWRINLSDDIADFERRYPGGTRKLVGLAVDVIQGKLSLPLRFDPIS
jgi:hypothetical protein